MKDVMRYIRDNITDALTLTDTARLFGYTPTYFSQKFHQCVGMTFTEYVRHMRIRLAAIEIMKGRKISDVAMDFGYESVGGFNKAFLKEYGCLAREYRKRVSAGQLYKVRKTVTVYQYSPRSSLPGGVTGQTQRRSLTRCGVRRGASYPISPPGSGTAPYGPGDVLKPSIEPWSLSEGQAGAGRRALSRDEAARAKRQSDHEEMRSMGIPRPEYPRPQMVRDGWMNLNGEWQFEIDHGESGEERRLYEADSLKGRITVPFCPESALSGVGYREFMECVWYRREVRIPDDWTGGRVLLHVGACDYAAKVWVNGRYVGSHRGGYTPFCFDITDDLKDGAGVIVINAIDRLRQGLQPMGKQCERYESYGVSYTRTTGIWQTVWMEHVPDSYIVRTKYTCDIDAGLLYVQAVCENADGLTLRAEASWHDKPVGGASAKVFGKEATLCVPLSEKHLWEAGNGQLYDLTLTLGSDTVASYFGLRSISYTGGKLLLNGKPVFQRLVLDQGFYPEGVYTAPTADDLKNDILRSMAMGFNGARLHEKIFEPLFLYYADQLGYLVWGEHAHGWLDLSLPEAWKAFLPEWLEAIQRDGNHPAIVGWCPLNESRQDLDHDFVKMLVDMTRACDATRPVIDSSGFTHTGCGDITDMHCYEQEPEKFKAVIDVMVRGEGADPQTKDAGKVTFVSEFGGTWWSRDTSGWGYGVSPISEEEFLARFKALVETCLNEPKLCAFCYTQLTDVEQERNGLYTYDRRPKFPPETIAKIVSGRAAIEAQD